MLKIGSEVGQPDTRYLSRSIVALNLERSWPRTTRVTLVWSHPPLPSPPSLHLEGTNDASFTRAIPRTPRVARSLFEVEALTGLRHQLHLPVCTCTSACDEQVRSTDTVYVCVCVCVYGWYTKRCWPRFYRGGEKVIESQKSRGEKIPVKLRRCLRFRGVETRWFFNFLRNCVFVVID